MSAFICDGATIDAAVSAIWDHLSENNRNKILRTPVMIGEVMVESKSDLQKLATALYAMNCQAVDARYTETNPRPLHRFQYITAIDPVFGVKQVSCLDYQCAEGDVPETALYKALEELESAMCRAIVSKLPAYDKAPWGCGEKDVNRRVMALTDMVR